MQAKINNININHKAPIYRGKIKGYHRPNIIDIYPMSNKYTKFTVRLHHGNNMIEKTMWMTNIDWVQEYNSRIELNITLKE